MISMPHMPSEAPGASDTSPMKNPGQPCAGSIPSVCTVAGSSGVDRSVEVVVELVVVVVLMPVIVLLVVVDTVVGRVLLVVEVVVVVVALVVEVVDKLDEVEEVLDEVVVVLPDPPSSWIKPSWVSSTICAPEVDIAMAYDRRSSVRAPGAAPWGIRN